jgi:hypothetical protein
VQKDAEEVHRQVSTHPTPHTWHRQTAVEADDETATAAVRRAASQCAGDVIAKATSTENYLTYFGPKHLSKHLAKYFRYFARYLSSKYLR